MNPRIFLLCSLFILIYGCSTSEEIAQNKPASAPNPDPISESIQPADTVNFNSLQEPPENWYLLGEKLAAFPGIGSRRAYQTILSDLSPKQEVIVAVIDGGVDITHEDLKDNIWTNTDEVPDNGKDDDNNGYVDDVHGWNFIGGPDEKNVDNDTFELTRIYARLHPEFSNADTTTFTVQQQKEYEYYKKIVSDYRFQINKILRQYNNIRSLEQSMERADQILIRHFNGAYTNEQLQELQPRDQQTAFAKNVMSYVMENDIDSTLIAKQKKQLYEFAKYGYNPDFNPRSIVGDNYADKTEQYYGNNDVTGPDATHGTHVAGIIGAVRNNGIGMNGVAKQVLIMPVRAVPNGDERDKDVANAIRYAVDNGADIINMSFGKSYSPYKEVVDAAVKYADEHGVLMIHAAGNSSENSDEKKNFPSDTYADYYEGSERADLWLAVGASSWRPDSAFAASFSNYGDQTVDIFAPGVSIYSTIPDNKYERNQGTSMAAPVVSGVAAVLMAYYPDLNAAQIRTAILESVKKYPNKMVVVPHKAGDAAAKIPFSQLSVSDGVVNLFNALKVAEKMSAQ